MNCIDCGCVLTAQDELFLEFRCDACERKDLEMYQKWRLRQDADDPIIHVCQGPPRCQLTDDVAVQAQKDGCPLCTRITVSQFGSHVVKPVRQ